MSQFIEPQPIAQHNPLSPERQHFTVGELTSVVDRVLFTPENVGMIHKDKV
jgi:hypothetical protein